MSSSRIPFRVVLCDSEEEGFTAAELESVGPGSRGWRSAQYCLYPQELILQLRTRATIERIQLLVHNNKIPTTVEVEVGDVSDSRGDRADASRAMYVTVGSVPLSNNKHTDYVGRQLQTVEMVGGPRTSKAQFVRLYLYKNHINRRNEYNQVSLIAVNVIGVAEAAADDPVDLAHHSLPFRAYCDKRVARAIVQLDARKTAASAADRREYGRKLKHAISGLEKEGEILGALIAIQKRKKGDVADFGEIDSRREAVLRHYDVAALLEKDGPLADNDQKAVLRSASFSFGRRNSRDDPMKKRRSSSAARAKPRSVSTRSTMTSPPPPPPKPPSPPPRSPTPPRKTRTPTPYLRARTPTPAPPSPSPSPSTLNSRSTTPIPSRTPTPPPRTPTPPYLPPPRRPQRSSYDSYDARGMRPSANVNDRTPIITPTFNKSSSSSRKKNSDGREDPEISLKDREELSAAIEVFGAPTVARLLRKEAQEKDEAYQTIRGQMKAYSSNKESGPKPTRMMKGASQVIVRLLRDKLHSNFSKGADLSQYLFGDFMTKHGTSKRELQSSSLKVATELLSRTADTTSDRTRSQAQDAILQLMANDRVREVGTVTKLITTQSASTAKESTNLALSKAEMVLKMLDNRQQYGITSKGTGPKLPALIDFGLASVDHSSSSVRKLGERIVLRLYDLDGDAVRGAMPEDSPKIRKANINYRVLFEEFDKRDKAKQAKK